uniref:Uncharacterized protein n=1 Tax=Tanacetum cinerariifolium TaxID=118510 RepID=A0A699K3T5_TANCI|nr:hypothetical protein [Tanacetum cinerariifolium]
MVADLAVEFIDDVNDPKTRGVITSTKPRVLDVPKYNSESEKESWGNSDEDEDDTEDESEDDKGNDDDGDNDDDDDDDMNGDDKTDSNTESDIIKIPDLNQSSTEFDKEKKIDEEEDDDITKEYKDVNVNLENEDADMTYVDQTEGPLQSSSVSSDFTSKLLNLKNVSLTDNEIVSLMYTTVRHEVPSGQTSSLYIIPVTVIPEVTSTFTTTFPPPPPFFNTIQQHATTTLTPTASEITTLFPTLLDFSFVFKFNDRVTSLEKHLSEMKQVDQNINHILELTTKKELYVALVKSYNTDKDLFDTYDRGTKRRKSSKKAESLRDPRSNESKSSSSYKGTSRSHHKSSGKFAHAEGPSYTVEDSIVRQNQEFDTSNNDE